MCVSEMLLATFMKFRSYEALITKMDTKGVYYIKFKPMKLFLQKVAQFTHIRRQSHYQYFWCYGASTENFLNYQDCASRNFAYYFPLKLGPSPMDSLLKGIKAYRCLTMAKNCWNSDERKPYAQQFKNNNYGTSGRKRWQRIWVDLCLLHDIVPWSLAHASEWGFHQQLRQRYGERRMPYKVP